MVVVLRAELGLSPFLFSEIFHATSLGGVTSALYETLRHLAYRVTGRIFAKQILQRLEKVGT